MIFVVDCTCMYIDRQSTDSLLCNQNDDIIVIVVTGIIALYNHLQLCMHVNGFIAKW